MERPLIRTLRLEVGQAGLEKGLELQLVLWASSSHILLISRMTCLFPCTSGKKALKVTCLARKITCPGLPDVTSFELSGAGGELRLENNFSSALRALVWP